MLIFICFIIFIETLLNLCPPITRDALIHHLAIPKIWLNQKSLQPIYSSDFSFYPMNIQLLYAICLWLNIDILSKFIHMFFGLGTGFLIYIFIKDQLNKIWAILGALMFISLPIVLWLSTSAYIDLGMTFFTTSSILFFIKFQWNNTKQIKYLIYSAIFMGLALGSKYNALIVFFYLNVAVIYLSEKNGNKFSISCCYGFVFFIIALFIVSPWYIKNYIYTGNPFYPLFNSLFKYFNDIPIHPLFCKDYTPELNINAITLRKILFNESILETLLIPIRMFFQGDDKQYQYFQGQLNPMLIIFIPFIFFKGYYKAWMKFLLVFIFFYGYIAFFTTRHQVRYLLPIFPFLCILSVFGFYAILNYLKSYSWASIIAKKLLILLLIGLFTLNINYLFCHFSKIDPIPYITGKVKKTEYLTKHLPHYKVYDYVNKNLSSDVCILTLFFGRRGYYLDYPYVHEPHFGINIIKCMIKNSHSEKDFNNYIDSLKITNILIRTDIAEAYLKENYTQEEINLLSTRIKNKLRLVHLFKGYALWEI